MNIEEQKLPTGCEEQILLAVCSIGSEPVDSGAIREYVNEKYGHEWAPQTVSTFLARLVKKGYLTIERKGKMYCYMATITLEQYRRARVDALKELIFDGSDALLLKCIKESREA